MCADSDCTHTWAAEPSPLLFFFFQDNSIRKLNWVCDWHVWFAVTALPTPWKWLHHTLQAVTCQEIFSSEGILRKPEELALLINGDTGFSFWNKCSWVYYWSSRLLQVASLCFQVQQLKGNYTVLYCSVKQYDISICTWCHLQLFASLLVNSQFRSICEPKMKWVKATRNSMQMKQSVATFYCCSTAWTFCAVAI